MQVPHNLCLLIACMHLKLLSTVQGRRNVRLPRRFALHLLLSNTFQQKDAPVSPLFCGNAGASSIAVLCHAGSQPSAQRGTA